jgi:dihydrofolate reductase
MRAPTRKVILGFGITIDGYIARPDGAVDYLKMTKEAAKLMHDFFATLDTMVMGRKTMEASLAMQAADGSEPPKGPWVSYVFSRTLPPGERNGATWVNDSPAAFVRRIRRRPGKHIFLMGGGELGRSFLEADLVDELFLGIVPILLGAGIPGFPASFPQRDWKLVENKTYGKNDVALRYARIR